MLTAVYFQCGARRDQQCPVLCPTDNDIAHTHMLGIQTIFGRFYTLYKHYTEPVRVTGRRARSGSGLMYDERVTCVRPGVAEPDYEPVEG